MDAGTIGGIGIFVAGNTLLAQEALRRWRGMSVIGKIALVAGYAIGSAMQVFVFLDQTSWWKIFFALGCYALVIRSILGLRTSLPGGYSE